MPERKTAAIWTAPHIYGKGIAPQVSETWVRMETDSFEFVAPLEGAEDLLQQWMETHAPIAQIREIEALAEAVVGNKQKAHKWLSEPNAATDDKPPIVLLGDQQGYDRVRNLLLRIEYGVLA